MAVLHLGPASALALLSAAGSAPSACAAEEAPVWGNIAIARVEANATVPLVVENGAAVPVRVMGCNSTMVPPNGTARFLLVGLAQLWLIPDGRAADCHAGPFDNLFYVAADLVSSSPVVSIAHTAAKPDGATSQNTSGANDSGIGHVELIAGTPTNDSANATAVCCSVAACGPNVELAALPNEVTIVVLGPGPCSPRTRAGLRGHDGQEGEFSPQDEQWADMASQQPRPNSTAVLHVQNRAQVPVRLVGCSGTAVAPGQSLDVPLAGMSRFWVAPNDTSVDCHKGPFDDLFYFAADLLGPKPIVTVGYGVKDEDAVDALAANQTDARGDANAAAADEGDAVAGLELAPGPPGVNHSAAVRCREDKCERRQEAVQLAEWPTEFTLTVMGPQSSVLSFWRRSGAWGRRGWGGRPRGWGGDRWGPDHFGGRDWP